MPESLSLIWQLPLTMADGDSSAILSVGETFQLVSSSGEWVESGAGYRQIEDWACEGVVRDSLTEIDSMLSDKLHVPLFHFSCLNRRTPYELYFDAIEFIWMTFQTCPLPSFVFRYQVEAQLDYGPGSEIRVGWKIGVTWSRKRGFKMAANELGYLLTKLSFWRSLWRDITISWHGGKEL